MSSKLKQVLQTGHPKILPPDYATIDCINENDMTTQTNQRVTQSYVQLTDMKLYVFGLLSIVERVMKSNDKDNRSDAKPRKSKVIVFLPTAKLVKFFTEVFKYWSSLPSTQQQQQLYDIYSIHSRMSQGSRNRASTEFRTARNNHCLLLSSDVSARGVDYPDVSLVVQVSTNRCDSVSSCSIND
jgi:ATP-dependent RNA helicase MSS116